MGGWLLGNRLEAGTQRSKAKSWSTSITGLGVLYGCSGAQSSGRGLDRPGGVTAAGSPRHLPIGRRNWASRAAIVLAKPMSTTSTRRRSPANATPGAMARERVSRIAGQRVLRPGVGYWPLTPMGWMGGSERPSLARGDGTPLRGAEPVSDRRPPSLQVALPARPLPKGGGAIRSIGEVFVASAVTGTGSMSIPIPRALEGAASDLSSF